MGPRRPAAPRRLDDDESGRSGTPRLCRQRCVCRPCIARPDHRGPFDDTSRSLRDPRRWPFGFDVQARAERVWTRRRPDRPARTSPGRVRRVAEPIAPPSVDLCPALPLASRLLRTNALARRRHGHGRLDRPAADTRPVGLHRRVRPGFRCSIRQLTARDRRMGKAWASSVPGVLQRRRDVDRCRSVDNSAHRRESARLRTRPSGRSGPGRPRPLECSARAELASPRRALERAHPARLRAEGR